MWYSKHKSVPWIISFLILAAVVTVLLMSPALNMFVADSSKYIDVKVVYEKGSISPSKNFTDSYFKGDKITTEIAEFKVWEFKDDFTVRLKPNVTVRNPENNTIIEWVDLRLNKTTRIKIGDNIIALTLKEIHEKKDK